MAYPSLNPIELIPADRVEQAIQEEFASLNFRPTAVVIALTHDESSPKHASEVVLVKSTRDGDGDRERLFWLPQGGIKRGESPQEAGSRELHEEVFGILPTTASDFTILGAIRVEQDMRERDDEDEKFTVGKLLVAKYAIVSTPGVSPNPEENIAEAILSPIPNARLILRANAISKQKRSIKSAFEIMMIDEALKILRGSEPTA